MKRLTLITLLALPVFVFAQTTTPEATPIDYTTPEAQSYVQSVFLDFFRKQNQTKPNVSVSLSSSPSAVSPNATVNIYARSSGESIGNALVVWYKNGREVQRGRGMTSYTLTAGDVGSEDVIEVAVTFSGGTVKTARLTITPASVRFLWEADTTTPEWYKGGSLAVAGSRITVRAFPTITQSGATLSRTQLRYDWELNRAPLRDQSGVGRDVLRIDAGKSTGITQNISVAVSSLNGSIQGRGSVSIPIQSPELRLYRQLPLLGVISEESLLRTTMSREKSLTVRAIPFFAPKQPSTFVWQTENESLGAANDPFSITVRTPNAQIRQLFYATLSVPSFSSRAETSLTIETD